MGTGLFIILLNPAIALVLASAFFVLWQYQKSHSYLAVLCCGYACSAVGFLLQYFTLPIGLAATKLLSNVFFTTAICLITGVVAKRYGKQIPYMGAGLFAAGGLAGLSFFLFVQPDITWRVLSINFAFGGICLIVAAELRVVPNKGPIEKILLTLSLLSGLNFIVRPLLTVLIMGPFVGYAELYSSVYWTTAVLSHGLLSLLLALCLFTAAALDVLATLKSDSHTDPLSKLLNRRGFETSAEELLERCANAGFPVALILADLDHFKAVNDRHGHAVGDQVIASFAARLASAVGTRGIASRMGGEEFAVLLPLADLASARLFAEAVRTLFSTGQIDDIPPGVRVTASFGVAARSGGECLEPLMRRADDALYKAKQNGRNSVRLSYERPSADLPKAYGSL